VCVCVCVCVCLCVYLTMFCCTVSAVSPQEDQFSVEKGNHMLMFTRVGRPHVVFLNCTKVRTIGCTLARAHMSVCCYDCIRKVDR